MTLSRRKFVGGSLAASALSFNSAGLFAAPNYGAVDTIIFGGEFYTMDPAYVGVEALAIRGDRIIAVGSRDDIKNLKQKQTRMIDAHGMTVVPGFIDAHSHPLMANEAISVDVGFRTIPEVQGALAKMVAQTPRGHWVQGHMYDDTKFQEGRPVSKADLDAVSTEHPIFIQHRGGHTGVVNTMAYTVAGLKADSPDPKGGMLYRDANGYNGRIAETALDLFKGKGIWPKVDRRANQENVKLISKKMAAAGLTSTTDAYGGLTEWQSFQDSYHAGEMSFRVSFMPGAKSFSDPNEASAYELFKNVGIRTGYGDNMLRVGAVKLAVDGSASERTMRMSTPYKGRPDDFGILTMDQDALDAAVQDAVANGFRVGVHANGDVAIDMVMNSYEKALVGWQGQNPRFRIEHCSLVNPELLKRIKAAGVIPAPFYTYAQYHGEKWHEYGSEKMEWMFAHKSFIDAGIRVAPASDFTPGPFEPMMALESMVTRKDLEGNVWGPSQRISVEQAMQVCTMNGAQASFDENIKGSLTPGKLADIVLLDQDPHAVAPDTIKDIKVRRTLLGGNTVFEA